MEIEDRYETMKRGSMGSYKIYSDFLKAWKAEGYPKKLRQRKVNGRWERVIDNDDLREQIEDKADSEKRRDRIERAELEYRSKMNKLIYG
jgi:hypothetical protein